MYEFCLKAETIDYFDRPPVFIESKDTLSTCLATTVHKKEGRNHGNLIIMVLN